MHLLIAEDKHKKRQAARWILIGDKFLFLFLFISSVLVFCIPSWLSWWLELTNLDFGFPRRVRKKSKDRSMSDSFSLSPHPFFFSFPLAFVLVRKLPGHDLEIDLGDSG